MANGVEAGKQEYTKMRLDQGDSQADIDESLQRLGDEPFRTWDEPAEVKAPEPIEPIDVEPFAPIGKPPELPKPAGVEAPGPPDIQVEKFLADLSSAYKEQIERPDVVMQPGITAPRSIEEVVIFHSKDLGLKPNEFKMAAKARGVDLDWMIKEVGRRGKDPTEVIEDAKKRGVAEFAGPKARELSKQQSKIDAEARKYYEDKNLPVPSFLRDIRDVQYEWSENRPWWDTDPEEAEEVIKGDEKGLDGKTAHEKWERLIEHDEDIAPLFDMHGTKLVSGKSFVDGYVEKKLAKMANFRREDSPHFDAAGKPTDKYRKQLEEQALYTMALGKTVGAFMGASFVPWETLHEKEPSFKQALMPTIEVIGINANNEVVLRQQSGLTYTFEMADILQSVLVGTAEDIYRGEFNTFGESAVKGVAERKDAFTAAWEATEDSDFLTKAAVRGTGFAITLAFPDMLVGVGGVGKLVGKGVKIRNAQKVATTLGQLVEARTAKNWSEAARIEKQLSEISDGRVVEELNRIDAMIARNLSTHNQDMANVKLAKTLPGDASVSGYNLHPTWRRDHLKSGKAAMASHEELYGTGEHLRRIEALRSRVKAGEFVDVPKLGRMLGALEPTRIKVLKNITKLSEDVGGEVEFLIETALTGTNKKALINGPTAWADRLKRVIDEELLPVTDEAIKAATDATVKKNLKAQQAAQKAVYAYVDDVAGSAMDARFTADARATLAKLERAQEAVMYNNESRAAAALLLRERLYAGLPGPFKKAPELRVKKTIETAWEVPELSGNAEKFAAMVQRAAKNISSTEANLLGGLMDARSRSWAKANNLDPSDWPEWSIKVEKGEDVAELLRRADETTDIEFQRAMAGKSPLFYSKMERVVEGLPQDVYFAQPASRQVQPASIGNPIRYKKTDRAVKQGEAKVGDAVIDPATGEPRRHPNRPERITEIPERTLKETVLDTIRSGKGVKEEEIKWTYLEEFLDDAMAHGKTSITRDEILTHLKRNRVEIEIAQAGGLPLDIIKAKEAVDTHWGVVRDAIKDGGELRRAVDAVAPGVYDQFLANEVSLHLLMGSRHPIEVFAGRVQKMLSGAVWKLLDDVGALPAKVGDHMQALENHAQALDVAQWPMHHPKLGWVGFDKVIPFQPVGRSRAARNFGNPYNMQAGENHPHAVLKALRDELTFDTWDHRNFGPDPTSTIDDLIRLFEVVGGRLVHEALGPARFWDSTIRRRPPGMPESWDEWQTARKKLADIEEAAGLEAPKYGFATAPGGDNYREIKIKYTAPPAETLDLSEPTERYLQQPFHLRVELEGQSDTSLWEAAKREVEAELGIVFGKPTVDPDTGVEITIDFNEWADAYVEGERKAKSHFGDDVIAHGRVTTRVIRDADTGEAKRVLFVEEIQSDPHQKAKGNYAPRMPAAERMAYAQHADRLDSLRMQRTRVIGYLDSPAVKRVHESQIRGEIYHLWKLEEEMDAILKKYPSMGTKNLTLPPISANRYNIRHHRFDSRVPELPFQSTQAWTSLVIKRIMQSAVDEGYDGVAFTRGDIITPKVTLSSELTDWTIGNREYFLEVAGRERAKNLARIWDGNVEYYGKTLPSVAKKHAKVKELKKGIVQLPREKVTEDTVDLAEIQLGLQLMSESSLNAIDASKKGKEVLELEVPWIELTPEVKRKVGGPQVMFQRGEPPEVKKGVPAFYSKMAQVAETMPKKMGVNAVEQFLRNRGVKAAEIRAADIEEFLEDAAAQGKKSVTRDEVMTHIKKNRIVVGEYHKKEGRSIFADRKLENLLREQKNSLDAATTDIPDVVEGVLDDLDVRYLGDSWSEGDISDHLWETLRTGMDPGGNLWLDKIFDYDETPLGSIPGDPTQLWNPVRTLIRDFHIEVARNASGARAALSFGGLGQGHDRGLMQNFLESFPDDLDNEALRKLVRDIIDLRRRTNDPLIHKIFDADSQFRYFDDLEKGALPVVEAIEKSSPWQEWLRHRDVSEQTIRSLKDEIQAAKESAMAGGENYREIVLTLPEHTSPKGHPMFEGSHVNVENALVHVRTTDRTDKAGRKILYVEEIQSDWHQRGRKHGYWGPKVTSRGQSHGMVPDAPFKDTKTWTSLAIKRIMQIAVDEGYYDAVAFTKGETAHKVVAMPLKSAKEYYDKIVLSVVKKHTKAPIGKTNFGDTAFLGDVEAHLVELTLDVKKRFRKPQVMFQPGEKGAVKAAIDITDADNKVMYAFEKADISSIIHEMGHLFRRELADADMGTVSSWLKAQHGIKVGFDGSRFTGTDEVIEQAEEMFARAFEQYVTEGRAPSAQLGRIFEQLKEFMLDVYKVVTGSEIDVKITPEMRKLFGNMLVEGDEPDALRRVNSFIIDEILGPKSGTATGVFSALAEKSRHAGHARVTSEALQKQYDEQGFITLPGEVAGKTKWSETDLRTLQDEVSAQKIAAAGMEQPDIALRSAADSVKELSVSERIDNLVAGWSGPAGVIGRVAKAMTLGGDADNVLRELNPGVRKAIKAGVRKVEQAVGDSATILGEDDIVQKVAYLSGAKVTFSQGRQTYSSGWDATTAVADLLHRSIDALGGSHIDTLHSLAEYIETTVRKGGKKMSRAVAEIPAEESIDIFGGIKNPRAAVDALKQSLLGGSRGEDSFLKALAEALELHKAEPAEAIRTVEVLSYFAGYTVREGKHFVGDSAQRTRMLLDEVDELWGSAKANRVFLLVAGHGHADAARKTWTKLGLAVDAATQKAFIKWTNGENIPADMLPRVQDVLKRYGINPAFVEEAVLDTPHYLPKQARKLMGDALARASDIRTNPRYRDMLTQSEQEIRTFIFGSLLRYVKKRMTRGAFITRPRYFLMNTFDHFNQMAMITGFRPAAASTSRMILQNILAIPGFAQIARTLEGARIVEKNSLEQLRRTLQGHGDSVSQFLSGAKYNISVNPVLEGAEGSVRVGDRLYSYRQLRDIAVEEGIFASFDTSQLRKAIDSATPMSKRDKTLWARAEGGIVGAQKLVEDVAESWAERERLGAMITLTEMGVDPRVAARMTIDALYDYAGSMSKMDRAWWVSLIMPFWAFQKNANRQILNNMFTPATAYRMGVLRRLEETGPEALTQVLFDFVADPYGVDVENLDPAAADNYWAIRTLVENHHGGASKVPEDTKLAIRMLFAENNMKVMDGRYYSLDAALAKVASEKALDTGTVTAPTPSMGAVPTYRRGRSIIGLTPRMNKSVRDYLNAAQVMHGDDYVWTGVLLPESTIHAGMRHLTGMASFMIATGALLGQTVAAEIDPLHPYAEAKASPRETLRTIAEPERNPVTAQALDLWLSDPESVQPVRISRFLAPLVDSIPGFNVLKYEGVDDPSWERVQKEVKGVAAEEAGVSVARYYIEPGIMSFLFENEPLGEFNRLLKDFERSPLDRATERDLLILARGFLGLEVAEISVARTTQFEDVRQKTTTARPK